MLETIAIHARPKAATPATVGEIKAPDAKEGAGASDFRDVLQTARKSLKPAKAEAGAAQKGHGAIKKPEKAGVKETANKASDTTDESRTPECVDGAKEPEVPQHESPRAKKKDNGREGDDNKEVEATDIEVVNAGAAVQQAPQTVGVPPAAIELPEEKAGGSGDTEEPIPVQAGVKQDDAPKRAVHAEKPQEIAEELPEEMSARARAELREKEPEADQAAVKKPLAAAERASRLPEANAVAAHKGGLKAEATQPKNDEPEKGNETNAGEATVKMNADKGAKAVGGGRQEKFGEKDAQAKEARSGNESQDGAPLPEANLPAVVKSAAVEATGDLDKTAVKAAVTEKVEIPVTSAGGGAENLKAPSAELASKAQELPGGEGGGNRDSTFDQIVLGLRGKLDVRNGKAEIQLNPPNLGSLRVSVNLANGTLTAQFQSDNASVRDLLLSQMDKLKSVLEGQGLAVDKLAVGPQVSVSASGPQSVLPAQRFPDSANPDGRSGGNYGYSGQQQRQDAPRDKSFAAVWEEAREAPLDLVA